ncbi:hypothetical protein D6825_03025 [Candidatus Woesearchaeota archaeon]|nr:MAG: hypothetical protein D6825_03025 [Candidatus Woesearchaeota archaeon]
MKKRTTLTLIALLIAISYAQAASVTLTGQFYETTSPWTELNINNVNGTNIITSVSVSGNLTFVEAAQYAGWTTNLDANNINWDGGSIEPNINSAIFAFRPKLPKVQSNSTLELTVYLDSEQKKVNLTILNDDSGPQISNASPSKYLPANATEVRVSAIIEDPQTGVSNASYSWGDCSTELSKTTLSANSSTYSSSVNFTGTDEGMIACYSISATNTAGETTILNGTIAFDGTAPLVELHSPTNYAYEETSFSFNAKDNIATKLECELILGGISIANLSVDNGTNTTYTANLSGYKQGNESWRVECKDGVGLLGSAEQNIIVDTQGPSIEGNVPSVIVRGKSAKISLSIADLSGIKNASATFAGNPLNLEVEGDEYNATLYSNSTGKYNLTITATDTAGQVTTKNFEILAVPDHRLSIRLSPKSAQSESTITAQGTLSPDGNATNSTVLVKTPSETINASLENNSYSITFKAPKTSGTYTISAEYIENGITYSTNTTLTIVSTTSSVDEGFSTYSSGTGARSSARSTKSAQIKTEPKEEPKPEPVKKKEEPKSEPDEAYSPIEPQEPRKALTPKATGAFTLKKAANWTAVLLAFALLTGLGIYGYKKRRPKEDWERYFDDL